MKAFLPLTKAAVSVIVVLANFLSMLQLAIPSLLSVSPHVCAAVISTNSSRQEDPAHCGSNEQTDQRDIC